jgi:hypothetical protein
MGAQRKDLKLSKVYRKNKKCFSTGKKTALKSIWYYKPWEAFLYTDLLFDADGIRYTDYLRARDELRQQPPVKKKNMLEVPNN